MNRAAHGLDVAPADASEATRLATTFLATGRSSWLARQVAGNPANYLCQREQRAE